MVESEQIIWETSGWKMLEEKEKSGTEGSGRNPGFGFRDGESRHLSYIPTDESGRQLSIQA